MVCMEAVANHGLQRLAPTKEGNWTLEKSERGGDNWGEHPVDRARSQTNVSDNDSPCHIVE